jgi:hypothetical protein
MKNMNPLIHLKKATPSFVVPFVQKRRTTVKRISTLLFVLAVVVTTTTTVYAQCSNATLNGSYGFKQDGFGTRNDKAGGPAVPLATVGVVTFDGAGNASFTLTNVFNSSGGAFYEAIPATYTVNSDCTGTVTIEDFGLHFYIVTVGGGAEFFAIQTDIGSTNIVDGKKQ